MAEVDLEQLLRSMSQYGRTRVMHLGEHWSCTCELQVKEAPGAAVAVSSDYNVHKNPRAAARQCYERVLQTVASMEFVTTDPTF